MSSAESKLSEANRDLDSALGTKLELEAKLGSASDERKGTRMDR